jgi:hypothetical protein
MELKDRFSVSADELEARMNAQEKYHDLPLRSVTDFIADAIRKVLGTLGVDVTKDDESVKLQQELLGITIAERPPEEMGELSGFYIIAGETPIAIVGDAFMAKNGLAYLKIFWLQRWANRQTDYEETFGGVRIIQ